MTTYNLPDGTVLAGDQPFAIARTYTRQRSVRRTETVEIEPERVIEARDAVVDPETGNIVAPAIAAETVPAVMAEIEHVETIDEDVTEPVRYPAGWLDSASDDDLAALGIVKG